MKTSTAFPPFLELMGACNAKLSPLKNNLAKPRKQDLMFLVLLSSRGGESSFKTNQPTFQSLHVFKKKKRRSHQKTPQKFILNYPLGISLILNFQALYCLRFAEKLLCPHA